MPDYQKLYYILFNAATDAEQSMDAQNYGQARDILTAAQQKAEELFLLAVEPGEKPQAGA